MRPRKKYRPKPVLADPVSWVINGFRKVDKKIPEVMHLHLSIHQAAVALMQGSATRHEMDFLITAANISIALISQGIGEGHEVKANQGRDAVMDVANRGWQSNHFVARGPELIAINRMLELHDAQFEIINMADLDMAVAKVIKMIRDKQIPSLQCQVASEPCTFQ